MTEKQSYFYTSPEGIKLIPGDTMPVNYGQNCYQSELEAAKASAIPVQNREVAEQIIRKNYKFVKEDNESSLRPDYIYGPFTVEYEIRYRTDKGTPIRGKMYLTEGGQPPQDLKEGMPYAILLPAPEKEPQEDPFQKEKDDAKEWELWRDFLNEVGCKRYLLDGEDFMSTRWEQLMDILKKEGFTITRKQ